MEKNNVTPLVPKDKNSQDESFVNSLSPREIVSELDRFVVGQKNAKRAPKSKTSSERITLEHIIAKNTEAKAIMKSVPPGWTEDKIKEFIGRFGNYVALGYTLNNKLSDKPTRDKVEPYKEQGLSTTARLMFKDNISTPTEGSNAETRVIEKYQYEVINLSFVEGFDEDDQPIFSEDWQKYLKISLAL